MSRAFSHLPLVEKYLSDKNAYTHDFAVPQLVHNRCDYYSIDIGNSSYDDKLNQFYDFQSSSNHGGKYNLILEFPIYTPSAQQIDFSSTDRGISTKDSTSKTVIVDPRVNLKPGVGDMLSFKVDYSYEIIYTVDEVSKASFLSDSYWQLTINPVPGGSRQKMDEKVLNVNIFLNALHLIVTKNGARLYLAGKEKLDEVIAFLNDLFLPYADKYCFSKDHPNVLICEFDFLIFKLLDKIQKYTLHQLNIGWFHSEDQKTLFSDAISSGGVLPTIYTNERNHIPLNGTISDKYQKIEYEENEGYEVTTLSELGINMNFTHDLSAYTEIELINMSQDETSSDMLINHLCAKKLIFESDDFLSNKKEMFSTYIQNSTTTNLIDAYYFLENIITALDGVENFAPDI